MPKAGYPSPCCQLSPGRHSMLQPLEAAEGRWGNMELSARPDRLHAHLVTLLLSSHTLLKSVGCTPGWFWRNPRVYHVLQHPLDKPQAQACSTKPDNFLPAGPGGRVLSTCFGRTKHQTEKQTAITQNYPTSWWTKHSSASQFRRGQTATWRGRLRVDRRCGWRQAEQEPRGLPRLAPLLLRGRFPRRCLSCSVCCRTPRTDETSRAALNTAENTLRCAPPPPPALLPRMRGAHREGAGEDPPTLPAHTHTYTHTPTAALPLAIGRALTFFPPPGEPPPLPLAPRAGGASRLAPAALRAAGGVGGAARRSPWGAGGPRPPLSLPPLPGPWWSRRGGRWRKCGGGGGGQAGIARGEWGGACVCIPFAGPGAGPSPRDEGGAGAGVEGSAPLLPQSLSGRAAGGFREEKGAPLRRTSCPRSRQRAGAGAGLRRAGEGYGGSRRASCAPAGAEGEAVFTCCPVSPARRCVTDIGVPRFLHRPCPLSVEAVRAETPPFSRVPRVFPPPLRMSSVG